MPSEWMRISVGEGEMDAYAALPEGAGPHPGVVVAMHVFGVDRFVQGKCDELAEAGYAAIAPYLFHRSGVGNDELIGYAFEDPKRRETAMPLKDGLRDSELVEDMLAALRRLQGIPGVGGPFGVTGFCIGGRVAYLLAVGSDEFSACADFYGTDVDLPWGEGASPLALTSGLDCPLVGFFGGLDSNPAPADVDKLEAELEREGKDYEFHRYSEGQHAFNDPFNPVRWNSAIAADAWEKLIGFFDRALKRGVTVG